MKEEYVNYLKKNLSSHDLDEGLKKLEMGISPQYIVGNVDFFGHIIEVNPSVLIPRFETELLVDKTIKYISDMFDNTSDIRILDIGTGSGCIAISLERKFLCSVDACDISSGALEVAKRNGIFNKSNVSFFESDLFSNVHEKYNVIISNPPYISCNEEIEEIVDSNEPHIALYAEEEGLYFYREILKNVSSYLCDKYIIAFEIGYLQADSIISFVRKYLGDVRVVVEDDYSHRNRFLFIFSE